AEKAAEEQPHGDVLHGVLADALERGAARGEPGAGDERQEQHHPEAVNGDAVLADRDAKQHLPHAITSCRRGARRSVWYTVARRERGVLRSVGPLPPSSGAAVALEKASERWHLDRLLTLWPGDKSVHRRRAVVLARLGEYVAAKADLTATGDVGVESAWATAT